MRNRLAELARRLGAMWRGREHDRELEAEMAAHLDLAAEDYERRGLTPEAARRQARISFGGELQARELHQEQRGLPFAETLLSDVRGGLRAMRRDAGLSLFAILITGLGVGASTTVFSVFHALLLRPLPFVEAERLVWIANGESANLSSQTVQVDNLLDLRAQSQLLTGVAAFSPFYGIGDMQFTGTGEPERVTGVPVTEDFFRLLGLQPHLGRWFTPDECRWQAARTVILSNRFWRQRLNADPHIVGRSLTLDNRAATVVGVLPASFDFASTFTPGSPADLFVPYPLSPETNRRGNTLALVGRLRPGAEPRAAQAEAAAIGERINAGIAAGGVSRNLFHPKLSLLRDRVSGQFTNPLLVLAGAVGFLMLLVCANLANLLLARASARRKEMAVRVALGAPRGRLIRQMLTESILLAACGAVLGLALAFAGTSYLSRIEGARVPLLSGVRVDAAAAGFTLLAALFTGLLFGLAPALRLSASRPERALRESVRGSTGQNHWLLRSIVVAQIALVCMLLTGAGLLARSLAQVLGVELGFAASNVAVLRIDPGRARAGSYAQRLAYFEEVLRQVRALPGTEAAGLTDALPLGDNYGWRLWGLGVKGQAYEPGQRPQALVRIADDGYLAAMKIPLLAGRAFTAADHAASEPVVLINETLARALWPRGEDPVGRVLEIGRKDWRVAGVVAGVRYFGPEQEAGPEMYLPIRQTGDFSSVDLVVRGGSLTAVRAALKAFDPAMPASGFRTMSALLDRALFPRRFLAMLLSAFAGFGLVLALLGIYAVVSYSVSQRRREIGIRMALGATPAAVRGQVLGQTLRLAALGLALGVPLSWMAARGIRGLLFGVRFSDPWTFGGVLVLVAAVAALSGYGPARAAARLNPLETLRGE